MAGIFVSIFALLNTLIHGAWVDPAYPPVDLGRTIPVEAGERLGQSFVAAHAGLSGVEVGLWAEAPARVHLSLWSGWGPQGEPLARRQLTLPAGARGVYRLELPAADAASHNRPYYLEVEAGGGPVRVGAAPAGTVLDGALSRNGQPDDSADLSLRPVYAPAGLAVGLLEAGLDTLYWVGASGLVLVIPGLALVRLARGPGRLTADDVVLAAGAGLAWYPVGLLWADLFGLKPGLALVVLSNALGLGALGWVFRRGRGAGSPPEKAEGSGPLAGLLVAAGPVLFIRLLVVRGLAGPQWGDSVHHALITELIRVNGGLFDDWRPYAELTSFTYHFGFHAFAAALTWITGVGADRAILMAGQVLNGLAVLGLYPLARRLFGSGWAGVVAVALAGLVFWSPAYYVRWGRYTQLAGQAILPAALVLSLELVRAGRPALSRATAVGVVVGGLLLTHYRVAVFYGAFAAGLVAWGAARGKVRGPAALALAGLVALGLTAPWWFNVAGGKLFEMVAGYFKPPASRTAAEFEYNSFGPLTDYLPGWAWVAAAAALGLGLWGRNAGVGLVGLWSGLAFLAANPDILGLPGAGFIGNFTLLIAAYMPAALLLGWAGSELIRRAPGRVGPAAILGLVGLGSLLGAYRQLGIPAAAAHSLLTFSDLEALRWVRAETPADARFLVNGFFAYGGTIVVGADAGWWLPLLAGRQASVPPMPYVSERPAEPGYAAKVNGLMARVLEDGPTDPAVVAALKAAGVEYVYIGQRRGRVNNPTGRVIEPAELLASPAYEPVYRLNRVWVFKLRP